jgi:hypothetical protein
LSFLIQWSLHTHSEHWQLFQYVFLFLAVGQIQHLPHRFPPSFFTTVGEASRLQVTPVALMTLRVCLSTFPLSAFLLICSVTICCHKKDRYRHLQLFFFCCQLGYFSIRSTNAFTQATSIKLILIVGPSIL